MRSLLLDGPAGYHVGLPVIIPVVFRVFGATLGPHLVLAVALGVAMSGCLYAVLRILRMPLLHAFAVATLVLVFPFSDSTRLWAMAGYNQLAVVLWLLGLLVALRGLTATGPRGALLHAGATILYVLGILVYELVAGVVLLSVVAYGLHSLGSRSTRSRVLLRWLVGLVASGAALGVVLLVALPRTVRSAGERSIATTDGCACLTSAGFRRATGCGLLCAGPRQCCGLRPVLCHAARGARPSHRARSLSPVRHHLRLRLSDVCPSRGPDVRLELGSELRSQGRSG